MGIIPLPQAPPPLNREETETEGVISYKSPIRDFEDGATVGLGEVGGGAAPPPRSQQVPENGGATDGHVGPVEEVGSGGERMVSKLSMGAWSPGTQEVDGGERSSLSVRRLLRHTGQEKRGSAEDTKKQEKGYFVPASCPS